MRSARRVSVLDCPFDVLSFDVTVERLRTAIERDETLHVVTANVDFIMNAKRDPGFAEWLWNADMVVADGVPVLWAARLLGVPLAGRVNGTHLAWRCAELSAELGAPTALIGGGTGVAERAAAVLRDRFPGTVLHPIATPSPLDDAGSRAVVEEARRYGTRIALVALGSPKQEMWLDRYLPEMGPAVGIGIGSAFDFISGDQVRAPIWMQRNGLEWIHRMVREPKRLGRRYLLDDSPFIWLLVRELARRGRNSGSRDQAAAP